MTEEQGRKIIELLESINSKLEDVQNDTSWIQIHTSSIDSNTSN